MQQPVKVDTSKFQARVTELAARVPLDTNAILKNECRLGVEWLADKTKPKPPKTKARIIKQTWRAWGKGKNTGNQRDWQYRGKRYRSPSDIKAAGTFIKKLIKDQVEHIGHFAAGFIGRGNPLGCKTPSVVSKQVANCEGQTLIKSGLGGVKVEVDNFTNFLNKTPKYKQSVIKLIQYMIRVRSEIIEKKLKLYKEGKDAKYRIPQPK